MPTNKQNKQDAFNDGIGKAKAMKRNRKKVSVFSLFTLGFRFAASVFGASAFRERRSGCVEKGRRGGSSEERRSETPVV